MTDFSKTNNDGWKFGIDSQKVADRLLEISNAIEAKKIIVKEIEISEGTSDDDYQLKTLVLTFNEQQR